MTGGSRGIGLAVARTLAADGIDLVLAARQPERLEAVADKLRGEGATVEHVVADLGNDEGREAVLAACGEDPLDIIVLNAGVGVAAPFAEIPRKGFDLVLNVNFVSPFILVQRLLPSLRLAAADNGAATIVAISSITSKYSGQKLGIYAASKAALLSACRTLNLEESGSGVRAVAICPAYVDTDMAAWAYDRVPRASMMPAEDIAELTRCVANLSPAAVVPEIVVARAGSNLTQA